MDLANKTLSELKTRAAELGVNPDGDRRLKQTWILAIEVQRQESFENSPAVEAAIENFPAVKVPVQKTAKSSTPHQLLELFKSRSVDRRQEPHEQPSHRCEPAFDLARFERESNDCPVELANYFTDDRPPNRGDGRGRVDAGSKLSQRAIALAAKNSPGVSCKTSTAHQLLELFKSAAHIIPDSPAESEMMMESAIGQTEADCNPISTGCTFSSRFLALYSPPQSEKIHYKSDSDGQLSLLDFEIESTDEPPDPDDFESIDAFRRAIALWDSEHCEFSSEHFEPLEVLLTSLESMCEWAPCPDDWYEPDTLLEPSEVLELPRAILSSGCANESSSTSDFSIPTFGFGAAGDRANGNSSDEPPTAGVGARLPKPKPPSFPPTVVAAGDRSSIEKFARRAILLSGRAPPGGDAVQT